LGECREKGRPDTVSLPQLPSRRRGCRLSFIPYAPVWSAQGHGLYL